MCREELRKQMLVVYDVGMITGAGDYEIRYGGKDWYIVDQDVSFDPEMVIKTTLVRTYYERVPVKMLRSSERMRWDKKE